MVFSELCGADVPSEIDYLIKTDRGLDDRLVRLLQEVALDNTAIDLVNLFVLKYVYGELSKEDLLIAINKYKANSVSVVD